MSASGARVMQGAPAATLAAAPPGDALRSRATLAVGLWIFIVALAVAELWMIAVTLDRPAPEQWGFRGFEAVITLAFGSVGALIVARQPSNRVGWLLVAMGLVGAAMGIVNQYPILSEASASPLPLAGFSRWVSAWIWVVGQVSIGALLPLLFPDGRFLSPRWRWAVMLPAGATAVLIGWIVLTVEPIGSLPPSPRVALVAWPIPPLLALGFLLDVAAIAAGAASLVLRYRRASTEARLQIKWFAYAAVFLPFAAVAGFSGLLVGQLILVLAAIFVTTAIAIAILRYRLYEIDLIINRTLVYGALSAMLAGVYTASITLSQRLFMAVTGDRSDAPIVLTTLIVVMLFTPLKSRLQAIVDRRVKAATPMGHAAADAVTDIQIRSSRDALEALERLIRLNGTGGLTSREFRTKKAELLRRV